MIDGKPELDNSSTVTRRLNLLSRLLLCGIAVLCFAATATAQPTSFGSTSEDATSPIGDLNGPIAETTMVVLAFLVSSFFFFLVVFRMLLSKAKNPTWPISAYGICGSAVIAITFTVALLVFWEDLVFGGGGFFGVNGGRLVVGIAGFICCFIVWSLFRSPNAKKARN